MSNAQITAAAMLRTRNGISIPVADRRGRPIGHVAQNRYGLWEAFRSGEHITGSHLSARDAIAAVQAR